MIDNLFLGLAALAVWLSAAILPRPHRMWGQAMQHELVNIRDHTHALSFALGCLAASIGAVMSYYFVIPFRMLIGFPATPCSLEETLPVHWLRTLSTRPRAMAVACAIAATGLGLIFLARAGAPWRYLGVNATALVLGGLLAAMVVIVARNAKPLGNVMMLVAGVALLATGLFGTSVDGVTRWVAAGPQVVQPSLLLLPAMVIWFARVRSLLSVAGLVIAAAALALQPDRAMATALVVALAALALTRADRAVLIALSAATLGAAATFAQPDPLSAAPYVERVFVTAFATDPLAGLAVLAGTVLLIVPALIGVFVDRPNRATWVAFGAVWLTIALAAAVGNYPTPVVGYGASSIIGYLLSLTVLPRGLETAGYGRSCASRDAQDSAEASARFIGAPAV